MRTQCRHKHFERQKSIIYKRKLLVYYFFFQNEGSYQNVIHTSKEIILTRVCFKCIQVEIHKQINVGI